MTESQAGAISLEFLRELADQFAVVARSLATADDLRSTFVLITSLGLETVDGAQHASVTVLRGNEFDTPTATSELPPRVDAIQYDVGSGPCVDAVLDDTVYRTGDLEADGRWPEFGKRAVSDTGVRSMLAVRLFSEDPGLRAALNLYSTERDAFAPTTESVAIVLATHAALALGSAGRREHIVNLEQAIATNREIGVAIGVLMTRHLVTQEQAFDLLRIASQRGHRKLRDVAASVVETGDVKLF